MSAFQVVGTYLATLRSLGADVPPALVAQIDPIVKAQCDALDGVKDGLIQNPAACNFRASRDLPRCADDQPGPDCFTRAQVETISALLTAVTDKEGRLVQPGYSPSEVQSFFRVGKRPADINAPVPWDEKAGSDAGLAPLGDAIMQGLRPPQRSRVLHPLDILLRRRRTRADHRLPHHRPPRRGRLRPCRDRLGNGGDPRMAARLIRLKRKLLIWHNGSDEKLTPFTSINYYKQLAAMYGGYGKLQENIRLFMLPDTAHCSMGQEGPGNFDALSALENWVEKGRAPDALVAGLTSKTSPMVDMSKAPLRTMPLCKFPEMARYDGMGDVNVAASWSCRPDDQRMLEVGESGRQAGVIE